MKPCFKTFLRQTYHKTISSKINPRTLKRGQNDPNDYEYCYIYFLRFLILEKFKVFSNKYIEIILNYKLIIYNLFI